MSFRAPWGIFWVGLGLRVATILVAHTYKVNPAKEHFYFAFEAGRIAQALAQGKGYANPFNGQSGPTAWMPPLYPLLIALSFKLFGIYSKASALFLMVWNSVFSAAVGPAVYEIAARCFDAQGIARRSGRFFGREVAAPVAMWSGWLWAVHPAAMQYAVHWIWEMSLSAMLFAWIVVLALRLRGVGEERGQRAGWLSWAAFGGLWGLLTLSNASLLLCFPAMMVWIAWPWLRERRALLRNVGGAALAAAVFALVMTPWVARNERVLHAFVLTRSNLGMELYNSTLDAYEGYPWGTSLSLSPGDPEFQVYVKMGEMRFVAMREAEARARIRERPGRIAKWTLNRFLFFWDGTPHAIENHPVQEYLRQLSYAFLSACGLLGLGLMLKRHVPAAGLFALVFVLVPLPYYLITVQPRFRHPMEPLIAVLAVFLFRAVEAKKAKEIA